jgi:hypothetical protein
MSKISKNDLDKKNPPMTDIETRMIAVIIAIGMGKEPEAIGRDFFLGCFRSASTSIISLIK